MIGATPELRDQVPHCIRMHAIERCAVPRHEFDAIDSAVMTELHAAANGMAKVEFIDPTAFFCNDAACPAIREGIPLYFDNTTSPTRQRKRMPNSLSAGTDLAARSSRFPRPMLSCSLQRAIVLLAESNADERLHVRRNARQLDQRRYFRCFTTDIQ